MANILLDYFFPITVIEPTPEASTAFLKQVCIVVSPNGGGSAGDITECVSMAEVNAVTDNDDAQALFDAGMNKVYVLQAADLELDAFLVGQGSEFYTLLISSDFDESDITQVAANGIITVSAYAALLTGTDDVVTIAGTVFTAIAGAAVEGEATFQAASSNDLTAASLAAQINAHATVSQIVTATVLNAVVTLTAVEPGLSGNDITLTYTDGDASAGVVLSSITAGKLDGGAGLTTGEFIGVVGVSSDDDATFLPAQAAIAKRCAFYVDGTNGAENMFYAFGKLLSNSLNWLNQQYVTMPNADDVDSLGMSEALFEDKVSFVISDTEFGERLALFAAGGKAITAPYITKNLEVDFQSAALSYISGNQPAYTLKEAALLEDELKQVIDAYINRGWIEQGVVDISLENDNFVASCDINISEPNALWRIEGEMRQTL